MPEVENCCGVCSKKFKRNKTDKIIECDADCKKSFHLDCTDLKVEEYEMVCKKKSIKWFCVTCDQSCIGGGLTRIDSEVQCVIESLNRLKDDVKDMGAVLNENLAIFKDQDSSGTKLNKKSYASVVKKGKLSESLIIESLGDEEGEVENYESLKQNVTSKLDPVKLGIGIRKVQACGKGKVMISCNSSQSVEVLRSEAKEVLGKKYQVREQESGWRPRLMVLGLQKNCMDGDEETFVNNVIEHNKLDTNNDKVFVKKVISFPDARFPRQVKVVLEVDAESRRRLIGAGILNLKWHTGRVRDHVFVRRCYKCGGYGHTQKDCKNEVSCPDCAGDHDLNDCRARETDMKCNNCMSANKKLGLNLNIHHSSRDHNCKSYQRQIDNLESRINYVGVTQ